MRICICDDDRSIHALLKEHIDKCRGSHSVETVDYYSGEELLRALFNGSQFDVYILDIETGAFTGMDIANQIRKESDSAVIIFVSSYPEYMSHAFNYEALHFIVKPIDFESFRSIFQRAVKKHNSRFLKVSFEYKHEIFNIPIHKIMYIESYLKRNSVHTCDEIITVKGGMREYTKKLENRDFLRSHQSFLVNMEHIKAFRRNDIELDNNEIIPISNHRYQDCIKIFSKYVTECRW